MSAEVQGCCALAARIAEMGVLRPGDRLVVRIDRPVSMAEADEMRAHADQYLPGVSVLFVSAAQAPVVERDPAAEVSDAQG